MSPDLCKAHQTVRGRGHEEQRIISTPRVLRGKSTLSEVSDGSNKISR